MKISPTEYKARLSDHGAWLRIAQSLQASAQLIWPSLQATWDQIAADVLAANEAFARGGAAELLLVLNARQPLPFPVIAEHETRGGCYLLLAGYAVENFLKAVLVRSLVHAGINPNFTKGSPGQIPADHRYEQFASKLGLNPPLNDPEKVLLRRLSVCVRWGGRYPMDKKEPTLDEDRSRLVTPHDRDQINALCERLIAKYNSLP